MKACFCFEASGLGCFVVVKFECWCLRVLVGRFRRVVWFSGFVSSAMVVVFGFAGVFAGFACLSFSGYGCFGLRVVGFSTGGDGGNPSLPSRKKSVQFCVGWFFGFGLFQS